MTPPAPAAPLSPGDSIGILGGGQLGRMLALAAANLGLKTIILDPDPAPPAAQVAARHLRADYADPAALKELAGAVQVVTYEFENVPVEAVNFLAPLVPTYPSARALGVAQDRLNEKEFFTSLGIAVAPFHPIESEADIEGAREFVFPAILKTRRFGYDGKGQVKVAAHKDLSAAWAQLGRVPALLEGFIAFDGEASVVAAHGRDGGFAAYPLTENQHKDHILSVSRVPAPWTGGLDEAARAIVRKAADALDYVGCLAVEFFVVGGGLIVNEMAPRVHNSGHWTLGGAVTSQFENHIRAVAGWPLGATAPLGDVEMRNLIGDEVDAWRGLLADPQAQLHLYGKSETRPGRKMGHVTRVFPQGTFQRGRAP